MHADAIPDADRAELADPARVAERIVALVAGRDTASGARVAIASRAGAASAPRGGVVDEAGAHLPRSGATTCACWWSIPPRPRARVCARRARRRCPSCWRRAICWSSTTPPPCPRRCAGTTRPGRAGRGAPDRRRRPRGGGVAAVLARRVLFGAGDWHTAHRGSPAAAARWRAGARLRFGALARRRSARAPRCRRGWWSCASTATGDALWAALYREGRPVQYAYLAHELPLWAVQTVYAARPWAFEMPSAGRPLSWEILLALRRRGVRWASLTHAAGLSATGDPAIDAALPLARALRHSRRDRRAPSPRRARRGGRVVAVGTTVVRALEGAAAAARRHRARRAAARPTCASRPHFRPRVVDGILSGAHAAHESHFALLAAFAGAELLRRRRGPRRARRLPDPRARRLDAGAAGRAGGAAAHARLPAPTVGRVDCRVTLETFAASVARGEEPPICRPRCARSGSTAPATGPRAHELARRDRDSRRRAHPRLPAPKRRRPRQRPLLVPAGRTPALRGEPRRRVVGPRPRISADAATAAPPIVRSRSGERLRFAAPSLDYASLVGTPSSSPAQDNALSRHERGFESRWGRSS